MIVNPEFDHNSAEQNTLPDLQTTPKELKIPEAVRDWITRVENKENIALQNPITDDQGQILMQSAKPNQVKIVLPIKKSDFVRGFKTGVEKALRWLSEQCFRIIKLKKGEVEFSKE